MDEGAVIGAIASHNSGVIGNISVTVNHQVREVKHVEKYPDGSIGRDAPKRNYVRYLLDQYYNFKKADRSFGVDPAEHAEQLRKVYGQINGALKREFGAYPNNLPAEKFTAVVEYLHGRIDQTRLGRKQKKAEKSRYKSFEEHRTLGE